MSQLRPSKLTIATWAEHWTIEPDGTHLHVSHAPRPVSLAHSPATGQALVSNGQLGVDTIRLEAGRGFIPHTHPGDHILIVIGGRGTLTYDGVIYPTHAGQVYLVDGQVPHAVGAITDHVILAVGSPHKAVDDHERMTPVAYDAVTAPDGDLYCLICGKTSLFPNYLHDDGCSHCPCIVCQPMPV